MELFADPVVRYVLDWVALYLPPKAEFFVVPPARSAGALGGADALAR
jgi:hypothetical protein